MDDHCIIRIEINIKLLVNCNHLHLRIVLFSLKLMHSMFMSKIDWFLYLGLTL